MLPCQTITICLHNPQHTPLGSERENPACRGECIVTAVPCRCCTLSLTQLKRIQQCAWNVHTHFHSREAERPAKLIINQSMYIFSPSTLMNTGSMSSAVAPSDVLRTEPLIEPLIDRRFCVRGVSCVSCDMRFDLVNFLPDKGVVLVENHLQNQKKKINLALVGLPDLFVCFPSYG